jgi:hypothetical protein
MFCQQLRVTDWQEPITNGLVSCRKCEDRIGDQIMAAHEHRMAEWNASLRGERGEGYTPQWVRKQANG